jgi:amino acid transporter
LHKDRQHHRDRHHLLARERIHLPRTLRRFAAFALVYAASGTAVGLYSLFSVGLSGIGPSWFWGWVIFAGGYGLLALVWAELASFYPFAGSLYQWPAILTGRRVGWWIGWIYLWAMLFILASYYFILPAVLVPLFDMSTDQTTAVLIALIALVVAAIFNIVGMEVLGRFTKYTVWVEIAIFTVLTAVVFILAPHHDSPAVLFHTPEPVHSFSDYVPLFLAFAVLPTLFSLGMFEAGGTLGEETEDGPRNAPRAVIGAWAASFAFGIIFMLAFFLSMPDEAKTIASATPIQDIIAAATGTWLVDLYLASIAVLTILGANAYFSFTVRQMFSMARDHRLPAAKALCRTNAKGSPYITVIAVVIITGIPFFFSQELLVLAGGATALIFVAYFLTLCAVVVARLRGWPYGRRAPFTMSRPVGFAVLGAGLIYAGVVVGNLLWPRDLTNPVFHGVRVAYWLLLFPLVIGVIYYFAVQRRTLAEDDLADAEDSPDEFADLQPSTALP